MTGHKDLAVIDPGHFGAEPGAVDPIEPGEGDFIYTAEKDITLPIATRVAQLLAPVFEVVELTRTGDRPLDPNWKIDLALRARKGDSALVFVSIHLNSSEDPKAHGTETFHHPDSQEGKILAGHIQSRLVNSLGLYDRKVKSANFAVLRTKAKAAALAEVCFVSNPTEESLINQANTREKVARAIAHGVYDYLGVDFKEVDAVMPEEWEIKVMQEAENAGLIQKDYHKPGEPATKAFVLAVALKIQRQLEDTSEMKSTLRNIAGATSKYMIK
ncbi:MAG: N-acetylmuramoyl-L-alanine amidase family protein [Desulfuromonadaceae bacterium]